MGKLGTVALTGSGPRGGSRTGGDRSRDMGELSTVALAGETIAEVLRVAAGDGVGVCGQLVQLLCERGRGDGVHLLFQAAVPWLAEACSCAMRCWIRLATRAS